MAPRLSNDHTPFQSLSPRMKYSEALKYLRDPFVKEVVEERHVEVPWQEAGCLEAAVEKLVNESVGHFRNSINAVPMAIKKIDFRKPFYVIEDHPCIHLDLSVRMIALVIPTKANARGKSLKCTAVHVTGTSVIGKLYGMLSVIHTPKIPNLKPGDTFSGQMVDFHHRDGLCQIQMTFSGKSNKRFDDERMDADGEEDATTAPPPTKTRRKGPTERPRKRIRTENAEEEGV